MKYPFFLSKLATGCLLASVTSTALAAPPVVTELIVRFNHAQADIEQPQALAKSIKKGMAGSSIQQAVARPQNARPLIRSRSKAKQNKSSIAQINALSTKRKGPREELEEYIILSYPNREALEAAKKALENDPNVLWVGENEPITPLVEPSDPFYKKPTVGIGPQVPRDVDYQWAMEALNMSEVWDYSRGHAYIAAVDTGIEISHPDLQANFRSHFSYDFADNDDNVDELVTPALHAGHGTNVAGILAATPDNDIGVAGLCWDCSLMIAKTAKSTSSHPTFFIGAVSSSIVGMVDNGAQVINMSFGGANDPCQDPLNVFCKAIEYAESNDVVMAAAAGNESIQDVDFPARHPDVISVGAVDINLTKPVWSSFGPGLELDILAPGEHILSTFYTNYDWVLQYNNNPDGFVPLCGDSVSAPEGYGPCSGTSMASPHIAGISGILRSINPLLSNDQIKEILTSHASQADNRTAELGHGITNPLASVKAALGTAGGNVLSNRLTPLFSMNSSTGDDFFYTTSPQMALAAMYGTMLPQPPNIAISWTPYGSSYTPGYSDFPRPANFWWERPKASVYIFTTHNNPFNAQSDLVPLYRLSYQGNTTGTNPQNVDHVYTTEQAGIDAFTGVGYALDGIEGYIFPDYEPQPPGTVKLYRKYNPELDDHAIFPETELASMLEQGYTVNDGNEWIGYVYLNIDSDSDGLIDGFEEIIGTDSNNPDSDYDGISDGIEVNNYPYSDPIDNIISPVFVHTTPDAVTSSWYTLDFSESFTELPVLLSQIQTFDGSDAASLRMRNATVQGVELRVEEEKSSDSETGHTTEIVGFLGIAPGQIANENGTVIGEAGIITASTSSNGNWRALSFSRSYTNPIIIMNMVSTNGSQPSHIRLKNVSADNVQYQIEEWDYLDQAHTTETIAYVVFEQGDFTLADGKQIRAGAVTTNQSWQQVNFADMGSTPVVFSQSLSYNGGQAIVTRQRNVNPDGFSVRLQEEEANDDYHAVETVGYIAIQQE